MDIADICANSLQFFLTHLQRSCECSPNRRITDSAPCYLIRSSLTAKVKKESGYDSSFKVKCHPYPVPAGSSCQKASDPQCFPCYDLNAWRQSRAGLCPSFRYPDKTDSSFWCQKDQLHHPLLRANYTLKKQKIPAWDYEERNPTGSKPPASPPEQPESRQR